MPNSSSSSRASETNGLNGKTASVETCGAVPSLDAQRDAHHPTPPKAVATPVASARRNKRLLSDTIRAVPDVCDPIAGSARNADAG